MFVSWYSLGMRALEYRPGHFHDNSNDEGSYSQNVHEVGRWIEEDGGSNFWGVHVDEMAIDGSHPGHPGLGPQQRSVHLHLLVREPGRGAVLRRSVVS